MMIKLVILYCQQSFMVMLLFLDKGSITKISNWRKFHTIRLVVHFIQFLIIKLDLQQTKIKGEVISTVLLLPKLIEISQFMSMLMNQNQLIRHFKWQWSIEISIIEMFGLILLVTDLVDTMSKIWLILHNQLCIRLLRKCSQYIRNTHRN